MVARTKRLFSGIDKQNFLKELERLRDVCRMVCTKAPIHSDAYKMADKLMGDIDAVAGVLTGDRRYFCMKPHSTS